MIHKGLKEANTKNDRREPKRGNSKMIHESLKEATQKMIHDDTLNDTQKSKRGKLRLSKPNLTTT